MKISRSVLASRIKCTYIRVENKYEKEKKKKRITKKQKLMSIENN
jgi:hypothetical protein